jgi:hypothetical protein
MSRIYVRKVAVQALQLRRKWQSMSKIYVRKVVVQALQLRRKWQSHVKEICKEGGSG